MSMQHTFGSTQSRKYYTLPEILERLASARATVEVGDCAPKTHAHFKLSRTQGVNPQESSGGKEAACMGRCDTL